MSTTEALVLVGGLVLGYWVVSKLIDDLNRDKKNPLGQEPPPAASTDTTPLEWHEVLNVSPAATVGEIRAAHEKLMSENHPEQKAREISTAYEQALRSRGETA